MRKKPFFPMLATDLAVWAYNYKNKIGNFASSLGMTPEEVTSEIAICNKIIDAINDVFTAKASLKSTVKTRNSIIATEGFDLRKSLSVINLRQDILMLLGLH
jgi:hypothetical protein